MKKGTIEQTLFFENKNAIANLEMNVAQCQTLIQEAVNDWNLICPVPLKLEELKSFLTSEPYRKPVLANVETLLKEKLIENKPAEFSGLQLDREKLKDLLVLPDTSAFLETLEKFSCSIPSKTFVFGNVIYWNYYMIEKGIVQVLSDDIEIHKDTFREYAKTPDEINRLKTVMPLCECLNNLIKENPEIEPYEVVTRNLIVFDEGKFSPSFMFIGSGRI